MMMMKKVRYVRQIDEPLLSMAKLIPHCIHGRHGPYLDLLSDKHLAQ